MKNGGRGQDWTADPYDVNVVLSHWATRPLEVLSKVDLIEIIHEGKDKMSKT